MLGYSVERYMVKKFCNEINIYVYDSRFGFQHYNDIKKVFGPEVLQTYIDICIKNGGIEYKLSNDNLENTDSRIKFKDKKEAKLTKEELDAHLIMNLLIGE